MPTSPHTGPVSQGFWVTIIKKENASNTIVSASKVKNLTVLGSTSKQQDFHDLASELLAKSIADRGIY